MNSTKQLKKSVAVIGGGLAGLSGALYLARAGLEVHLFDKSAHAGGRARSLNKSGMFFNLGAHALYANGAGRAVLDELRIPVRGAMPDITANDFIADERQLPLPTSAKALLLHRDFNLREKWELIRVMAAIQKTRRAPADQSLQSWLHARCRAPRVRRFFEGMFRLVTYSADLDLLSADVAIDQFQIGGAGVMYLDGGWQSLVDELLSANQAAGTRIHAADGVAGLERNAHDGRMRLRRSNGERKQANAASADPGDREFDYVLLACDPQTAQRLAGGVGVAIDADAMQPVRAACLDVALTELPRESGLVLDFDRRLYFAIHSNTARLADASAPRGAALIHTAKYLRQGESGDGARRELEALLDRLQPGWRDRVIHEQYLARITVVQDQPDRMRGGLEGRVKTDCGAAVGLYFAGDWVGDESFLSDAAFASAKRAAGAIVGRALNAAGISPRLQKAAHAIASAGKSRTTPVAGGRSVAG